MFNLLARLALTALFAIPALPAVAYDALREIVRVLPDPDEAGGTTFNYMNPAMIQSWPIRAWIGVGLPDADAALLDSNVGIEKAGIDFTALEGVLHWGLAPESGIYLVGDAIDRTAVRDALTARPGMSEEVRDNVTILAEGDDYGTDPAARDPDYPFGGGWRGHRVAAGDGAAFVAFSWPDLERGLEAAEPGDSDLQEMLAAMVDAAEKAVPLGFEAHAAAMAPVRAYAPPDPDAREDTAVLPAFEAALLIGAAGDDWEAAQIVLAYLDHDDAGNAATSLADRIEEDRPEDAKLTVRVSESDMSIAVVSLVFPPGAPDHPSSEFVSRWINDAYSGRLDLMMVVTD